MDGGSSKGDEMNRSSGYRFVWCMIESFKVESITDQFIVIPTWGMLACLENRAPCTGILEPVSSYAIEY